jgi:hypothetical protein
MDVIYIVHKTNAKKSEYLQGFGAHQRPVPHLLVLHHALLDGVFQLSVAEAAAPFVTL